MILAVAPLTWLAHAASAFLLAAVKEPMQLRAYAASRQVQFAVKYWLCFSSLTVAALVLQQDWRLGRPWTPFYAVITAPIVFNERVRCGTLSACDCLQGVFSPHSLCFMYIFLSKMWQITGSIDQDDDLGRPTPICVMPASRSL